MSNLPGAQGARILTVTPNPALGRTLFVDVLRPGRRHAVRDRLLTVSGKGVDAALVLRQWGAASVALGFSAGENGRLHDRMLVARGAESDWVWVQGETRTNVVVVATENGSLTTFSDDTLIVAPKDEDDLVHRFEAHLEGAQAAVLGGPLPQGVDPDLYTRLLTAARRQGVPAVLDAVGPHAQGWLAAGPAWIKPNRHELEMLTGRDVPGAAAALAEAVRLHEATGVNVLASLDAEGAIAAGGGRFWRIPPIDVPVVSAEGAGDAMVAGLALALACRLSIEDTLRLAVAAAAAALLQARVGDCDSADVLRLLDQVQFNEESAAHA